MIHSKGRLLVRLGALTALLVVATGASVLVLEAQTGGSIRVWKRTLPAGGKGFEFTDNIPVGPALFYLDDGENQYFSPVGPGTYAITETNPAVIPGGWILTDVDCWADNNTAWKEYTVATTTVIIELTNEEVQCIFTNEQPPSPIVGGYVIPVNRLELLTPWLAALAASAALGFALIKRRRA
jgi:hypothetical protein